MTAVTTQTSTTAFVAPSTNTIMIEGHGTTQACRDLLSQLTPDEVELAARAASYEYLCQQQQRHTKKTDTKQRIHHAQDFCQRFLNSTSQPTKALKRVKATLQFRQEMQVDELRTAFTDTSGDNNKSADTRQRLEKHLKSRSLYVQGHDKQGRATYIFTTRNVTHHDQEWTLKSHMYTLERALACSKGDTAQVNALIDFRGFSLTRHAPPTSIGKQFMNTFRQHYAGAIHQIFLIDAPSAFFVLWNVMKHFVGTKTRDKIHFISSKKPVALTQLYNPDQLPSWLGGTGTDDDFDLDEYLYEIPFDAASGDAI